MKFTSSLHLLKKINGTLFLILFIATFLRFFMLLQVPHGLYMDEISIGYNARFIEHTGKDEYGQIMPLFFRSFDDYKAPGYIYLTSLTMRLFGDNDFAVRFPSAIAGVLLVFVLYLFIKKVIFLDKITQKYFNTLPYLGALLLAISSFAIHFSRGGFETNVALFLYFTGALFALYFYDKKQLHYFILSALFFAGATYTYQSYRILAPFTFILISSSFYFVLPKVRKYSIWSFMLFALLVSPIIVNTFSSHGTARFVGTSTFKDYPTNSVMQQVYEYPMIYVKNFVSFYSYDYLFAYGDHNGRHQVVDMGLFYHWEFPFILVGFIWLLKRKKSLLKVATISFLLFAPLVPSLVAPSPHTLRGLLLVIPFTLLTAIGLLITYASVKRFKKIIVILFILFVSYDFSLYMHNYYFHYPNVNAMDWGGAYKETAQMVLNHQKEYKHFVVDNNIAFAKVYFNYYAPGLHPIFVDTKWKKPNSWKNGETLYIRPFYGDNNASHFVGEILLPGPGKSVFAQLVKI